MLSPCPLFLWLLQDLPGRWVEGGMFLCQDSWVLALQAQKRLKQNQPEQ